MHTTLKRDRLIEAVKIMFYQQGVTSTTLADIAQQAQVPLGNIYYHFRTKEALVEAVIQAHLQELQSLFAQLDRQPATTAALLFQAYLDWAATQFRLLGKDEEEARDLAMDLIASLQGTFVLTSSFRAPELLERKLQRLETWLCSL